MAIVEGRSIFAKAKITKRSQKAGANAEISLLFRL